jgi:hypothetical protein
MKKNKGYLIVGFDGEQYFTPFSFLPLQIGENDRSNSALRDNFNVLPDLQTAVTALSAGRGIAEVNRDGEQRVTINKVSDFFLNKDLIDINKKVRDKFNISSRLSGLYFGVPTDKQKELEQYLESLIFKNRR